MEQATQFIEIVGLIKRAKASAWQSVNAELINCYWQVGEYISRRIANASWGDKTVAELANYIERQHPDLKNFDRRGLYRMKQFYESYFQSSFVSALRTQLQNHDNQLNILPDPTDIRSTPLARISWTNHRAIFSRCKTEQEREFYIRASIQENFNTRELDRQISAGLFERVMLGKHQLSKGAGKLSKVDLTSFKDTYILDFLHLPKEYTETDLQKALVARMKDFVLELGKDFLFIGQEYRLQVGNSDFEIDILFYHRGLQCLVAFELLCCATHNKSYVA